MTIPDQEVIPPGIVVNSRCWVAIAFLLSLLPGLAYAQATALTVAERTANQVVQRDIAATTKAVPFTGTYTGTPTAVDCKVDIVGGGSALAYTALTSFTASAGNWSGTLPGVPQGAWYTATCRDHTSTSITGTQTNQWGVGIVVAAIGQSNMVNWYDFAPTGATISSLVKFFNGTTWVAPPTNASGAGGGFVFVDDLQATIGGTVPVGLIKGAVSATLMSRWLTAANGGSHDIWDAFVTLVAAAGGDFETAAWMQGESQAYSGVTGVDLPANYPANLILFHQQLLTLTGRSSSQFLFGVASLAGTNLAGTWLDASATTIRAAQINYGLRQAVGALPGAYYMGSMYDEIICATGTCGGGNVHWQSYVTAGLRWARATEQAMGLIANGAKGPAITTGVWPLGSSTITVNTVLNEATGLKDGAGNTNCSANGGAAFVLAGTAATVSAMSCAGSTITLTTSAARQAGDVPTLTYAAGQNPFNQPSNGITNDNPEIYGAGTGGAVGYGTAVTNIGWPLQPTVAAISLALNNGVGAGTGAGFRH